MRLCLTAMVLLLSSSTGWTQTRTGTTTGSTSGNNTFGQGFSFGSSASQVGTTGAGMAGTGMAGGTGGTGTFGSPFSFNSANTGTATGMTGMNRMGMGMGGMSMGMGGMGMGGMGMGGMGMGRGGMGGMGMNNRGGMGNTMQQRAQIRPTVKIGFESTLPSSEQRTQQVSATVSRLPQPERFQGANVTVEGRKAIVTGSLPKQADANLLKQLLLLEPGIYEVDLSALTKSKSTTSSNSSNANSNSSQLRPAEQVSVPAPE